MRKKKQEKRDKKNDKYYYLGTFLIVFIISFFIFKEGKRRGEILKNNSFKTYTIVEELKERATKSTTTTQDILYTFFIKENKIHHKITSRPNNFIENNDIKIGDVFEIKVAAIDYGIFTINFKNKIDTIISKPKDLIEIFNNSKHRKHIED